MALLGSVACRPKQPAGAAPSTNGPGSARVAAPLTISFSGAPEAVGAPIGALRRGINLGNGFDAPSEGAWGVVLSETHFEMAKAAGLDHVRLPVRFSTRAQKDAPYTIDPAFFERVDWAVQQALSRGLSIIIDLHHYEELMKQPDSHMDRTVGMWKQIAERYATQPDTVLFELLNEPNGELNPAKNNALIARLIPVIRASNPTRTLIVDSYFWAAPSYLKALELPNDPNIAVSFHMYQPILFTHQGASWMDPEFQTTGIIFPGPGSRVELTAKAKQTSWVRDWMANYFTAPATKNPASPATVAAEFDMVTKYVAATGRRAYLGEFGAIDFADAMSRENYLRLVRREAERRGFAWAVWDDGGRMQAMNVKQKAWVEPVAKALFQDQPSAAP